MQSISQKHHTISIHGLFLLSRKMIEKGPKRKSTPYPLKSTVFVTVFSSRKIRTKKELGI